MVADVSGEHELDMARHAFTAAHGRLQDALTRRDVPDWYGALGETLWWIVSIDEHYRDLRRDTYEEFRNSDVHGRVVPGLRLARNRVGHGLALLVSDPSGRSVLEPSKPDGVVLDQLVWRPSSEFTRLAKREDAQRLSYDGYLARNPVRYGIRHANYFFIRRRDRLEEAIGL